VTGEALAPEVSREERRRPHWRVGLLNPGWVLHAPLVQRRLDLDRRAAFEASGLERRSRGDGLWVRPHPPESG
jgi:hypothetical protein